MAMLTADVMLFPGIDVEDIKKLVTIQDNLLTAVKQKFRSGEVTEKVETMTDEHTALMDETVDADIQ